MTQYLAFVWLRAMNDADADVMRLTASISGGRKNDESLPKYVARVREQQDAAIAKWITANDEYERAKP